MEFWDMNMTGPEAYRPGFCYQRMLKFYAPVWTTSLLVNVFALPAKLMFQELPTYTRFFSRLRDKIRQSSPRLVICVYERLFPQTPQEELDAEVDKARLHLAELLASSVLAIVFGTQIPILLTVAILLCPLGYLAEMISYEVGHIEVVKDRNTRMRYLTHEVANLIRVPVPSRLLSLLIPVAYWTFCFLLLADYEATLEMKLIPVVIGCIQVIVGAFWEHHYRQNTFGIRLQVAVDEHEVELDPLSPMGALQAHMPQRVIDFGKPLPSTICFNRSHDLLDSTSHHEQLWDDMM